MRSSPSLIEAEVVIIFRYVRMTVRGAGYIMKPWELYVMEGPKSCPCFALPLREKRESMTAWDELGLDIISCMRRM